MPDEAVKPLTDQEIDDSWPTREVNPATPTGRLLAQAKSANSLREQLAVLEAASLTGLMDENAALKAKLAAAVRLAKAHLDWQASYQIDECGDEDLWIETEKAEALCLSLEMGEALGLGE